MEEACEVFLSCTVKDREKVRAVKLQLEKGGYTTFWDEKASSGKELLHREAAQAIDGCSIFLCCLSQDYLENVLTLKEIKLAKFWSKSIVVVKCAPLPLDTNGKEHLPPKHDIVPLLGKLFPVDLSDPKTHAVKMRDLMSRLEKQLKDKTNTPPGISTSQHEGSSRLAVPVAEMQPDDVCQLLAELFIPADKIERFMENGVCGRDLLDFSDDDLKGSDLQLTAIQVKKLRRELQHLLAPPPMLGGDEGAGMDGHDVASGQGLNMSLSHSDMLAGARMDGTVDPAYMHSQADVENSMGILARNKEKGDPEQIVAALQACVYDARVQVEGMQVIRNLVWGKSEEQNAVATAAGIEAIIAGMRAHRDNVDVQEMGCSALGNLAWSNSAIQARIAELGGIEEIVRATQTHVRSGGCMQKCTLALGNLACHAQNQVKVAQLNGIQLILHALTEHPQHTLCIQYCCWALKNLCLHAENKVRVMRANGHKLVVAALKANPGHAGIVDEACQTLGKLAWGNAEHQNKIASEDGVEAIVAGMKAHPSRLNVSQQGALALGDLAWSNVAVQQRIGQCGGVQVTIAAMNRFAENAGCQQKCALALGNFACQEDNQVKIAQLDGISSIIATMDKHSNHQLCLQYCCWALKNLSLNEANKKRISSGRAPRLIVEALRNYPWHAGIVEEACGCIRKLVWGNAENQNRIAIEGGIEAIINGMTMHVPKASVQQQCGLALGDLAWSNESNQERIGRAGGIPPIIAGMHAHPTHSGTQGGLALGNLASLCTANRKLIAHAGYACMRLRSRAVDNDTGCLHRHKDLFGPSDAHSRAAARVWFRVWPSNP